MSGRNTSTQPKSLTQPWRQYWPPAPSAKYVNYESGELIQMDGGVHVSWPGPGHISIFNDSQGGAMQAAGGGEGKPDAACKSKAMRDNRDAEAVSDDSD
ncbi:hypothetical protein KJ359_006273 [Pestalotiopsis sp. 9143b]|nr:hypothetical protein KJ359_006273 [Pestalotiopsis sp. 9143b]